MFENLNEFGKNVSVASVVIVLLLGMNVFLYATWQVIKDFGISNSIIVIVVTLIAFLGLSTGLLFMNEIGSVINAALDKLAGN